LQTHRLSQRSPRASSLLLSALAPVLACCGARPPTPWHKAPLLYDAAMCQGVGLTAEHVARGAQQLRSEVKYAAAYAAVRPLPHPHVISRENSTGYSVVTAMLAFRCRRTRAGSKRPEDKMVASLCTVLPRLLVSYYSRYFRRSCASQLRIHLGLFRARCASPACRL
jgi:hypothetical protein